MGLDTTHDCWHGAYSAFMHWRTKLAELAGYPPLLAMEGFFQPENWWLMTGRPDPKMHKFSELEHGAATSLSFDAESVFKALPISWKHFESDPLSKLLLHSDCDGSIDSADCGPIADRLTELLPLLPEGDAPGHIGNWREKTQKFIDGLRAAAEAGEDVEFH